MKADLKPFHRVHVCMYIYIYIYIMKTPALYKDITLEITSNELGESITKLQQTSVSVDEIQNLSQVTWVNYLHI